MRERYTGGLTSSFTTDPAVAAIDPEVRTIDPKVRTIDPKVEAADPKVRAIDPRVRAIDPEVRTIAPAFECSRLLGLRGTDSRSAGLVLNTPGRRASARGSQCPDNWL